MTKATAPKKITGTRTAKPADKRGPKAGSAMSNQTAKLSAKSDIISSVNGTRSGGDYIAIAAPGQTTLLIPANRMTGQLQKLAVKGGSFKAVSELWTKVQAEKPAAQLARGVESRAAPQSAKAVSDAKAGQRRDPVAEKLLPKGGDKKAAAAKAKPAKEAKVPSTGGIDRKYKATKKEDVSKPDSFRNYMISTIRAHTQTSAAKAAHAASGKFGHERLNFKWAHDNGYIVLADLA